MNINDFTRAEIFINNTARPFEKEVSNVLLHRHSPGNALNELRSFQNKDGGFGNALEADNWNPNSNPIATNDAITWLCKLNAFDSAKDIIDGIVRYLDSHDSFDEAERKWQSCIESTKDYPHAVWWEKTDNWISGFNPTVSLAAFMVCYGCKTHFYNEILKQAVSYLFSAENIYSDELKCYLFAYEMMKRNGITEYKLEEIKSQLIKRIVQAICSDTYKYGIEFVTTPSDIFCGMFSEFVSESIIPLIYAELETLWNYQKEDGGFDILWNWWTPYPEFEQARIWWRPRITLEKLLFYKEFKHLA